MYRSSSQSSLIDKMRWKKLQFPCVAIFFVLVTSQVTNAVNYDLGNFILTQTSGEPLTLKSSDVKNGITKTFSAQLGLSLAKDALEMATPKMDKNNKLTGIDFGPSAHVEIEYPNPECTTFTWTTVSLLELRDCVDYGTAQWFGGPQQKEQLWPIQKLVKQDYSYVTKEEDNMGIAERLWFNSEGNYIHTARDVPLFIDSNVNGDNQLCFIAKFGYPYLFNTEIKLRNTFCSLPDAVQAHNHAFTVLFPGASPRDILDDRMVRHPIWSTWAIYKRDVNESVVMQFAQDILDNNFLNSQLEIDDHWETCYGELTFDLNKFPDPAALSRRLKSLGFRVTLWVHPFVNSDCPSFDEWRGKGYFVKDEDGNVNTTWWNGNSAAIVDFTNVEAKDWYVNRLIALKEISEVDSFKYDAGETSWMPKPRVLTDVDPALQPNMYSTDYVRALDLPELGPISEVRSGFNTQDLPVFVRMIDKDTRWSMNNGLRSLVTTLLEMNMVGYPFVLPDMIGGNGYGSDVITSELFIRWLQANTFMPALQFSYVPWMFNDPEVIAISQKFVDLHAQYASEIMVAVQAAVDSALPINPPIFFAASNDQDPQSYAIDDEYLLGTRILVAPVLDEGAVSRDVFLPDGTWKDENTGANYMGPIWLKDYPAPLDVLPYFTLVQSKK